MFRYIVKRIALAFLSFFIIMTTCFFLVKMLPLVVNATLGQDAEIAEAQIVARGYRDPILVQYVAYIRRILFEWDWGVGVNMPEYVGQGVWGVFIEKLPPTVLINVYSTLFAVPIGILLGIYSALKKNGWQDHLVSTLVMVFVSVPSYVTAFLVQYILCFKLGWLPLTMGAGTEYFTWTTFRSMLPAVFSLSFGSIAGYARFTRAELTEVLTSDYLELAKAKGLTKSQCVVRHALRNAMTPIIPSIIAEFIAVMSGSLIIEKIFSVPGVGRLYLTAITSLDYDFFMMLSAFYTFIGLLAGIVVDISYGFIDPRIRVGKR
ncbi:MAG: ABC transporter permease [Clostridia bacterium]|nr:ABC transporter permease [Clostridia bacterium]